MITSFFPGRIRLRSPIFKDQDILNTACRIMKTSSAVNNIVANVSTGSVLIEYNTDKIPFEKITKFSEIVKKLQKEAEFFSSQNKEKIINILNELNEILNT